MKMNFIFWNTREKINVNEEEIIFSERFDKDNEAFYYMREHEKIKVEFTEDCIEEFKRCYLSGLYKKHEKTVVVVKEIDDYNVSILSEASLHNNVIICGMNNCREKNKLNNVIYLPQLYYDEFSIDINTFIYTMQSYSENLIMESDSENVSMIFGCEKEGEVLGGIPIFILKHFNYVSHCSDFVLNLYGINKLKIDELLYIEDPLKEYMNENSRFDIIQTVKDINSDSVYFSLIAK